MKGYSEIVKEDSGADRTEDNEEDEGDESNEGDCEASNDTQRGAAANKKTTLGAAVDVETTLKQHEVEALTLTRSMVGEVLETVSRK